MKRFQIAILSLLLLATITTPVATFAWSPSNTTIIPCGTSTHPNSCTFNDLIIMGKNVMDFIMFVSIPISAALFAYAGFTLLMSGGNEGKREDAKNVFWSVAIGLVIMLSAWLIVYTITSALVSNSGDYFRFIQTP